MWWGLINEAGQVTEYRQTGGDYVYDPSEYGNLSNGLPVMRPREVDALPSFDPATQQIAQDPIVEVLPDRVVWHWQVVPRDPAIIAEEQRLAAIRAEADVLDLVNRLKTASASQINTWVDNNVANVAQARTLFKAMLKVLAYTLRLG